MPRETAETGHIGHFSQTREVDLGIAALATRQHGVVGRWQLLGLGLGEDGINTRQRAGRLNRLHAGVYAVGHRRVSSLGWYMAAVLASGPAAAGGMSTLGAQSWADDATARRSLPPPLAVLSHRSAAGLWGIRRPTDGPVHVTVRHKSRSSRRIKRHLASLPSDEITAHEGIPVTTIPRTIFDLAAAASPEEVEFAVREAEYRRLFDSLSLHDLLVRYPGRRGARRLRIALAHLAEKPSGRPASPLEEVFVPFLNRHRLPRPQLNAWIEAGGKRHRVDCLWPNRQIVELDGWDGHGTRSAFRSDRARDRRLTAAGYRVTRLTWAQLEDEPEPVAADLRALVA